MKRTEWLWQEIKKTDQYIREAARKEVKFVVTGTISLVVFGIWGIFIPKFNFTTTLFIIMISSAWIGACFLLSFLIFFLGEGALMEKKHKLVIELARIEERE